MIRSYQRAVLAAAEEILLLVEPASLLILAVNPAMARMHGYDSPEEMVSTITDLATQIYADPEDRTLHDVELFEQLVFGGFGRHCSPPGLNGQRARCGSRAW